MSNEPVSPVLPVLTLRCRPHLSNWPIRIARSGRKHSDLAGYRQGTGNASAQRFLAGRPRPMTRTTTPWAWCPHCQDEVPVTYRREVGRECPICARCGRQTHRPRRDGSATHQA